MILAGAVPAVVTVEAAATRVAIAEVVVATSALPV